MMMWMLFILMYMTGCTPLKTQDPLALHTVPDVCLEQRLQAKDRLQKSYDEERKKLEEEKASMIENSMSCGLYRKTL